MHQNLIDKINELVNYVLNYESDTFSATNEDLTQEEAEIIVALLLETENLDPEGDELDEFLTDIRDANMDSESNFLL